MHRVDGDVAQGQILVEVFVGADIAAAGFEPQFDIQLAALADGGDVNVAVEHFDVGVGLDLPAEHLTGVVQADPRDLDAFAHDLEGNLLEVENNVGGVFDHARNRAELVVHAFDLDRRDGRPFDRAQQDAPQAVADGGSESALKRLRRELAKPVRQSLGVGNQSLGFLKALEHRLNSLFRIQLDNELLVQ